MNFLNGLRGFLLVAVAGWLTGKMIGNTGYVTDWLELVPGIMVAIMTGYLFFGTVMGEGGSLAIFGSITLVATARLISTTYVPASVR